MAELNKYSKVLTQDETLPAAQAMLYGIGLTEGDLKKAQVGICSMGYDGNTCKQMGYGCFKKLSTMQAPVKNIPLRSLK